jgi:LPS export ABC transporter protein LptC
MRRLGLVLLGLSMLIILLIVGFAFKDKERAIVIKSDAIKEPPSQANLELKDVYYSNTNEDNVKEWELHAKSAQYFKDGKKVVLQDVEVTLYRSDGKIYQLTGKQGELDTDTKNIHMHGNIKGVISENINFATDSLFYDHNRRTVSTPDKVIIHRNNLSIEGLGMNLDLEKEKLSLLDNVKALGRE